MRCASCQTFTPGNCRLAIFRQHSSPSWTALCAPAASAAGRRAGAVNRVRHARPPQRCAP
ncbi:hypothetical protein AAZ33_19855 [Edwardsiella sp. LADL05-105]|nr:hypothetical protein AAZ33_19855 [Edwardsiella sp. LADL05-105]